MQPASFRKEACLGISLTGIGHIGDRRARSGSIETGSHGVNSSADEVTVCT